MKHPAVAMSAVSASPIRSGPNRQGMIVRARVCPERRAGAEIQDFVKGSSPPTISADCAVHDTLPMTATGKVLRRELRALG